MNNQLLLLIIFCFFFGCEQPQKEGPRTAYEENPVKEFTFSDYSKQIKKVDLPFRTTCDNGLQGTKLNFSDSIIGSYGVELGSIFGKIADNDKFTAIVYLCPADVILPVIQTTSKTGEKISKLQLFEKYCGEDEHSWSTSKAEITKDLTILLRDSVITYDRNKKGMIIEKSRKTEVSSRVFYIDSEGQIIEKK